ncbi:MAG: hypothetical protein ACQET5_11195 [Halobacteriota archaeon]|uniref:hypothetical protein n=1 Tax=Natronomonas sp. TaxID=2184060 RepID=UPI00397485AE
MGSESGRTGRESEPTGGNPIEAVSTRCGCAGKTPLDRIVRPALAAIRSESAPVDVAGDLEAGLLPNTTGLDRTVVETDHDVVNRGRGRFVAAAFVDAAAGSDVEAFRSLLADVYGRWAGERGATILKGHSIQVETDGGSVVWGEALRPTGRRADGYRAVNVDVIHAFPGLDPTTQAAIASAHALNDCYTQGAAAGRELRPIVGVPRGTALTADRVRRWYEAAVAEETSVYDPSVVVHDGVGWQFGASVVASTDRIPPVRIGGVEPGDEVSIHRALGGLALYAGWVGLAESPGTAVRDRAIEALSRDHAAVAEAIAASCPRPDEPFDPDRHLKWAGDVSGPGIRGLADAVEAAGCGVRLTSLPLSDRETLASVRDRWLVPDATVETNGPIAAIGTPAALDRFEGRLTDCAGTAPTRIGELTPTEGDLQWERGVDADRYLDVGAPAR